jgi:hypothetical protein
MNLEQKEAPFVTLSELGGQLFFFCNCSAFCFTTDGTRLRAETPHFGVQARTRVQKACFPTFLGKDSWRFVGKFFKRFFDTLH